MTSDTYGSPAYATCNILAATGIVYRAADKHYIYIKGKTARAPQWCNSVIPDPITNVFVCISSGYIHVCDGTCSAQRYTNQFGNEVCKISGHEFTCKVSAIPSGTRKKRRVQRQRRNFGDKAREVLHTLLFSERRVLCERRYYTATVDAARNAAVRYIRMERYSEQSMDAMTMARLYSSHMVKMRDRHFYLCCQWGDEQRQQILDRYVEIVTRYWDVFCSKIKPPSIITQSDFIIAIVYILRKGIQSDRSDIIPKDFILNRMLPHASMLGAMDVYSGAFTNTCKMIMAALGKYIAKSDRNAVSCLIQKLRI